MEKLIAIDAAKAAAAAAADKVAALKKSTISCIKGKLTKKVTAVNPKCLQVTRRSKEDPSYVTDSA